MLKYKLDSEGFDKLSEAEQALYSKDGDNYVLQVEGAVDKGKLDEFRSKNVELLKQQEKFDGVDLEKYTEMVEREKANRDKELIDAGEIEKLVEERTKSLRSDYEGKIENLTKQLDESTKNTQSLASKYEIDGAAAKAFAQHKISPDAQEAVMAQIRSRFTIDNGKAVAKDGDEIVRGENGNLTIDEFVAKQPDIFKVPSNGGAGKGNEQPGAPGNQPKTALDRIKSGLDSKSE